MVANAAVVPSRAADTTTTCISFHAALRLLSFFLLVPGVASIARRCHEAAPIVVVLRALTLPL